MNPKTFWNKFTVQICFVNDMMLVAFLFREICLKEIWFLANFSKSVNMFFKSQVNSILRHVGELMKFGTDEQMEELYTKTAWFFDDKYKKPGASYEAFKHAVT